MEPLTFALAALFVYRASRMLTDEEGPFEVFTKLRGLAKPDTWIGRGLECIMCVSAWVALPVALWIDWHGDWALTWLALSAITVIIRRWEQKR
jgi:hypothetical protein